MKVRFLMLAVAALTVLVARLLIMLTGLFLGSAAAENTKQFAAMGIGTATCAQFANMYRGDPEGAEAHYFTWAQGFMSGWNTAQLVGKEAHVNLASMSTKAQQQHLRSYCDQNPLANFTEAIRDLMTELAIQSVR